MDVTVTLTTLQAMQVQTALGERIMKLYGSKSTTLPGSFEADVVAAALDLSDGALVRILDALYPPESADGLTAAKGEEDRGNHFVFPA